MHRVWTTKLDIKQRQMVQMPRDAKILSLIEKYEFPHLYYLVEVKFDDGEGPTKEPTSPIVPRIFSVVCAGEVFEAQDAEFVGSLALGKGGYIAHVFEHPAKAAKGFTPDTRYVEDHRDLHRVRN